MKRLFIALIGLMVIGCLASTPCFAAVQKIELTPTEEKFIKDHPVIKLGVDPKFVPFEFIGDDGSYKGITADYLALVTEMTGLRFEVEKGLTWPEAYDKAVSGELDALPAVGQTPERQQHFAFSQPYYQFKRVIVTRVDSLNISNLKDLEGRTVAVQRNSSHHSYILTNPKIIPSLYDSVEAALAEVAAGNETAFVGNLATTSYIIRNNGITGLRLIAFEAEKRQTLHLAARRDWPELISIFNKAVNAIPDTEKAAITERWVTLEADIDYGPLVRNLAGLGALIAAVLAVSFYWIAKLRVEISERKKAQIELEQAKQIADEANEFKSSFLARMSHEIRTPLNAITGMAYLLKKTELTLTQRMYADRITQASSNMLSIINDILDYSKIEAGKVELESASFSMDQIIQEIVNIVSYKIDEQGIGFRMSKDPLIPNWFIGDSKRIGQVLLNVLNNAAKFTSKGEVSLDIRLLAKESTTYHLSFTIKDSGIGMSEDQVASLFQPFTQGDTSINRRFGGSGLGLSIVKNLVGMMGGDIQVFSTPNEGSTFIIHLSLQSDTIKEEEYRQKIARTHFNNFRVLVLEKAGSNMNLIESYLSAFGMQCELTSSESSAINMLEAAQDTFNRPFDLLIVDYETPIEGGFAFVESIRRNKRVNQHLKYVMLLPMMREDLFDKLNEHGIDVGVGKPIIPSILLNGIMDIFKVKALSDTSYSSHDTPRVEPLSSSHLVLVAEDNKTNQLITESLLGQIGVKCLIAGDGSEAVALYKEHKVDIDLILMDLHMSVMNGYEASRKIREISTDVPIVAITADVIMGVKEQCEECGIQDYVSKPFDPDAFLKTIITILDKNNNRTETEPISVLNSVSGIKNVGGSLDVYRQILEEYYTENQNTLGALQEALDEGRYADAAQIVHKIKSSSGSIGATKMYEISVQFQKALDGHNEEEIPSYHTSFSRTLETLMGEIVQELGNIKVSDKSE